MGTLPGGKNLVVWVKSPIVKPFKPILLAWA